MDWNMPNSEPETNPMAYLKLIVCQRMVRQLLVCIKRTNTKPVNTRVDTVSA